MFKRYFILLLIAFLHQAYMAQDSLRIAKLIEEAEKVLDERDSVKGKQLLDQALSISSKSKLKDQLYTIEMVGRAYSMNRFYSKATECYTKGLTMAKDNKDPKAIATFYLRYTDLYKRQGLTKKAIVYGDSALLLKDKLDQEMLADVYRKIGRAYYDIEDLKKAIGYFLISQRISEKNNLIDKQYCTLMHYIGSVYRRQNENKKALFYYEKQLAIARTLNDDETAADAMNMVAMAYGTLGEKEKQLKNLIGAIDILKNINSKKKLAVAYGNLAAYYLLYNNLKEAEETGTMALQMFIKAKNFEKMGALYKLLGKVSSKNGEHNKAFKLFDSAFKYANMVETKNFFFNTELEEDMAWAYQRQGNYKDAFDHYVAFKRMNDSLNSAENKKFIQKLAEEFQTEQKDQEISLLNKDKQLKASEIKKQATQRNYLLAGLAMVFVFLLFMYRSYVRKKKDNLIISEQKEAVQKQNIIISEQKHLVEEKQKEILDSITYAKRLQEAILPPLNIMQKHLPHCFVFYQPKDIVAGDFYWMESKNNKVFIAAADSTGHGVPGALVSIVCSNALNRALKEFNIEETGKILDKTRSLVLETFEKSNEEVKDGMDISLLCIDQKNKQIQWSGANNPLWYISSGTFKEIKADKQPVGRSDFQKPFTTHLLPYQENDVYYLITDGYADQFGGPSGKKFKYKQLNELLVSNHSKPMNEQVTLLRSTLQNWRGDLEQVDDVCVIGIRV